MSILPKTKLTIYMLRNFNKDLINYIRSNWISCNLFTLI